MNKFSHLFDSIDQDQEFNVFGSKVSPKDFLYFFSTEGISFHFGQSAEDVILLRLFNKKRNGFYVDIGAFHPRKYSNTYIFHKYFDWHGINIDASEEAISLFNKERPNDINIRLAVGDTIESRTYWKFNYPARNTISEKNVERQLEKGAKVIGEESVQVYPLDYILEQHVTEGQDIDLLNLDIEGMELQALKSNNWDKFRPRVMIIEDYNIQKYGVEGSEIYSYLKQKGYRFFSHSFDSTIYIDDATLTDGNQKMTTEISGNKKKKYMFDKEVIERAKVLAASNPDLVSYIESIQVSKKDLMTQIKNLTDKLELKEKDIVLEKQANKLLIEQNGLILREKESLLVELKKEKDKNSKLVQQIEERKRHMNHQLLEGIKYLVATTKQNELINQEKDIKRKNKDLLADIRKLERKLFVVKDRINKVEKSKDRYKRLYKEILQSRSWRYTAFARQLFSKVKKILNIRTGGK